MLWKMALGPAEPVRKQPTQAPSTPNAINSVIRKSPQTRVSALPIQK